MNQKFSLNTRTIEYIVGILATALIVAWLFSYAVFEPYRLEQAQAAQAAEDLDGAMTLYAENCSVCHGLAGEGIGATPGLNTENVKSMAPEDVFKTIARGRFNTAMPAWSKEDGGPLSDYQIGQLVLLAQQGDWQATQDRVVNLGLAPLVPFAAEPDPALLEQVKAQPNGEQLALGVTLFAENCVACHGADGLGTAMAPALNDPLIRQNRTPEELQRTILNGVPATLMAGWANVLDETQVAALAALIEGWESVPAGAIPAPDRPVPVTAESLALGQQLFTQYCSRCHGPEGQGTRRAPALNVQSFLTTRNDAAIQQIVTAGVPGTAMPAWGDRMTDADIQAIVGFVRSWEPTAPEVATPAQAVGGPWWAALNGGTTQTGGQLPGGGVSQTQGTGQAQGGGQGQGQGQGQQGGGSPWNQTQQQTSFWSSLDWRAWMLLGLLLVAGLALVGVGLVGLRRTRVVEAGSTGTGPA